MYISMAAACFSGGLLVLGALLNRKANTRCLSLFCLVPMAHLCIEWFILGEDQITELQLVCMVTLLIGTLLITGFIARPRQQQKAMVQNRAEEHRSVAFMTGATQEVITRQDRTTATALQRENASGTHTVFRLPLNLDNNSTFE